MPPPNSFRSFPSFRAFASFASLASLAAFAGYCAIGTTAAGVASVSVPGCTIDDDAGYQIITGIVVRASTLVAGHGCGTGDSQIYKYAVVVTAVDPVAPDGSPEPSVLIAGGVFDCFADATFVNLCTVPVGNPVGNFNVNVYALNQAAWAVQGAAVQQAIDGLGSFCGYDAGTQDPQAVAQALSPNAADGALLSQATLTTTCTATQESSAEVVAVCQPVKSAH